nr:ribonuclease H-like domain-containing protein [Tanacetum cinerariifolium]
MASGGSDRDAKDALSKLLQIARATEARFAKDALSKLSQMGTVAEYQNEFEMLTSRVTGKSENVLKMIYISRLKVALQIVLLRANPTTLVEAFSLARMTEARFEGERTTTTIVNPNDLNIAIPDQVLEESILDTSNKVEFTSDNDAQDQASEVETKVTLSRSSIEAEYRGVANVVAETRWVCNLLREPHAPLCMATLVYFDNVSVVYMSTNPVHHQCTKHIDIDTYFVCDFVASG